MADEQRAFALALVREQPSVRGGERLPHPDPPLDDPLAPVRSTRDRNVVVAEPLEHRGHRRAPGRRRPRATSAAAGLQRRRARPARPRPARPRPTSASRGSQSRTSGSSDSISSGSTYGGFETTRSNGPSAGRARRSPSTQLDLEPRRSAFSRASASASGETSSAVDARAGLLVGDRERDRAASRCRRRARAALDALEQREARARRAISVSGRGTSARRRVAASAGGSPTRRARRRAARADRAARRARGSRRARPRSAAGRARA